MESFKGIDLWDENRSKNLILILDKSTPLLKIRVSELCAIAVTALSMPDVIPRA
jgi:hypothetical protein